MGGGPARRRRRFLRLGGVLVLLLAGCAGEPEPPPVAAPAPPPPAPDVAPVAIEPDPPPEFCPTLAAILSRESDGYAQLRAEPLGAEHWQAAAELPGLERCAIEGATWPRARISCSSGLIPAPDRERIIDEFELMVARVDDCLNRGFWFPRDWQRGHLFEFAMDERQLTWIDASSNPPSAVVLKVQQDLGTQDYLLKLQLETVR
ncbi:MAG TPA: hypothetical protein VFZ01_00800 [Geminicoccaceae bacterium]